MKVFKIKIKIKDICLNLILIQQEDLFQEFCFLPSLVLFKITQISPVKSNHFQRESLTEVDNED